MSSERSAPDPLRALEPGLAAELRAAAAEVDPALLDLMRALSLRERIAWASGCAASLARLRDADGAR